MGAVFRGHPQYYIEYVSDRMVCGEYRHCAGRCSSLKSARSIISKTRSEAAAEHPRDFKVFDTYADIDPATNHVPCVLFIP